MTTTHPTGRMLKRALPEIEEAFIASNALFNSYYETSLEPMTRVTKIECSSDMSILEYAYNGFGSIKGRLIGTKQNINGSIWTVKDVCNFEFTPENGKVKYIVVLYQIIKPISRSLNTTGVQFRVRQLEWDCKRFRKGLGELYTPDEINNHLAKPVTKKDILDGYLRAGHYFNNFKPRV